MDMRDEGPAVMTWMNDQFTRVRGGHPDYHSHVSPYLGLIEQESLARRRKALLQEEHCASWIGNQRERVTA